MAPKKGSADEAPAWLAQILKRWDDHLERFDKLFDLFLKLQDSQQAIIKRLDALEERLISDSPKNSDPRPALYSTLVKFKSDTKVVDAKACRITWIGIGEQASDAATRAFDKEAIKEVVKS